MCILTGHYGKESHSRFSILLTQNRAQVLITLKTMQIALYSLVWKLFWKSQSIC